MGEGSHRRYLHLAVSSSATGVHRRRRRRQQLRVPCRAYRQGGRHQHRHEGHVFVGGGRRQRVADLAAAQDAATAAAEAHAGALRDQATALTEQADAARAAVDAGFALRDAQQNARDAVAAADEVLANEESTLYDVQAALDDVSQAAIGVADAEVRHATEAYAAAGAELTATEQLDIHNASLINQASQLTGPTRQAIVNHIAELNGIPPEKASEILALIDQGKLAERTRRCGRVADP